MDLRDFAFAKDADALDYTDVEVDGRTFRVNCPTLAESARIESAAGRVVEDPKTGEKTFSVDSAELQVLVMLELVVDPETGENLFDATHRDMLFGAKKGSRLYRIAAACGEAFLDMGNGSKDTSEEAPTSDSSAA